LCLSNQIGATDLLSAGPGSPTVGANIQAEGVACTTVGALAMNSSGTPLACQSGFWRAPGVRFQSAVPISQNVTYTASTDGIVSLSYRPKYSRRWSPSSV
jgi:hypothetical protein